MLANSLIWWILNTLSGLHWDAGDINGCVAPSSFVTWLFKSRPKGWQFESLSGLKKLSVESKWKALFCSFWHTLVPHLVCERDPGRPGLWGSGRELLLSCPLGRRVSQLWSQCWVMNSGVMSLFLANQKWDVNIPGMVLVIYCIYLLMWWIYLKNVLSNRTDRNDHYCYY